jgi:MSHA biogenesis protein MshK
MKLDTGNSRKFGIRSVVMRTVVAAVSLAGIMTESLADDFAGLADPTQPAYSMATGAGAAVARPTGPALQSTFITASQRRAVISGRSYKVGDSYGGGKIADIQPYEVVVKQANRETRLRLLPKLAKQTHMVKVPVGSQEGGQNVDK